MSFNWKLFWEHLSLEFLLGAALQTSGMWALHRFTGKALAPPPTPIDPTDPTQVAHAAAYHIIVGSQGGMGDNAVFGRLINDSRITDRVRDRIEEMMKLPAMLADNKKRYHDFRYSIALIAQLFTVDGETKAVETLIAIGKEDNAQAAYEKAEDEGFLEPSDPSVAKAQLDKFVAAIFSAFRAFDNSLKASTLPRDAKNMQKWARDWATKK